MAPRRPSGTVTFLFTDIEGSTSRWERFGSSMARALGRHNAIVAAAISRHEGYIFKTVGDAFCAAFDRANDAVAAAADAQMELSAVEWESFGERFEPLRVRMGLHTGVVDIDDGDYFGGVVNRVARLSAVANGGQVLMSLATHQLVRGGLPEGCGLRDLGQHQLKDLDQNEWVFQLTIAGLPDDFPSLNTAHAHLSNLPATLTPMIGRDEDLQRVLDRLRQPEVRLVAITGAGGIGKSRLAVEAALAALPDFKDGAWLVRPLTADEPAGLVALLAHRLQGYLGFAPDDVESLLAALRPKSLLLVVEGSDVDADAARVIASVLGACPKLKILATSRRMIPLTAAHAVPLQPLALPPLPRPGAHVEVDVESAMAMPAVRLFLDRARAVDPDCAARPADMYDVIEICRQLDGLPLAIELAAARVATMTLPEMRRSLGFDLLTEGSVDLEPHQRTMWDTIDWSYRRLGDEEARLVRRMAVFVDGAPADAVSAVCAIEGDDAGTLLPTALRNLVMSSLVVRVAQPDGTSRFGMLRLVQTFMLAQLARTAETAQLHQAHGRYFLATARAERSGHFGRDQAVALQRLQSDHENCLAALRRAAMDEDNEVLTGLAAALHPFWFDCGFLTEGRRWLDAALIVAVEPDRLRSDLLFGASRLAMQQGDLALAQSLQEECIGIVTTLGDVSAIADSENMLGIIARRRGDLTTARTHYERVRAMRESQSDRPGEATAANNLGVVAALLGQYDAAADHFRATLAIRRRLGDEGGVAESLHNLAELAIRQGNDELARTWHMESLSIRTLLGYRGAMAQSLHSLGEIALRAGDLEVAAEHLHTSLRLSEDVGDRRSTAYVKMDLGDLAWRTGDLDVAATLVLDALAMRHEQGDSAGTTRCLEYLARMALDRGEPRPAAQLLGAADHLRSTMHLPHSDSAASRLAAWVPELEIRLGSDAYVGAMTSGALMPLDDVVHFAHTLFDGTRA